MKIVIDTKTDSVEEIQKAIQILSSLIGQQSVSSQGDRDIFSSESKPPETGVFNIFGNAGNTEAKIENEAISPVSTSKKDDDKEEGGIDFSDLEEYR